MIAEEVDYAAEEPLQPAPLDRRAGGAIDIFGDLDHCTLDAPLTTKTL